MKTLHWKRDAPEHERFPPAADAHAGAELPYDSAMSPHNSDPERAITGPKTIAQLAKLLETDAAELLELAQAALHISKRKRNERTLLLSRQQCIDLVDMFDIQQMGKKDAAGQSGRSPTPSRKTRSRRSDRARSAADRRAATADLRFPKLRHRLDIHPEVCDRLSAWPHLHRRLGIMLQHLAANGRSTVVKGCRNDNKGWRRSPLGGNNGMQWYLWWTPGTGSAARELGAPPDAIIVRDVRHHDDHSTLRAGSAADYLTISQADELIDDIAAAPWTDEQTDFIDGGEPVRIIIGRPGSGKTTALWKAIETRAGERVLYLTWSPRLTEQARSHLGSFAPTGTEIVARDFDTFLGEMSGADVPRQTLAESRAKFADAIRRSGRDMGPWARRPDALHGELRGMYFGRAGLGDESREDDDEAILHVSDDQYTALRDQHGGIGEKAAKTLLRVAHALLREPDRLRGIYPELAAATTALRRIRRGELPPGFDRFDRIVIDETQDLTMLEAGVAVELAKAVERRSTKRPRLLMAGDSGQTVRPTGFEWAPLLRLVKESLETPEIVHLDEHLRCPKGIAEIVDRAGDWYAQIDKDARPTKQRRQTSAEHVDAQILAVKTDSEQEAVQLLNDLNDIEGVVIINPAHDLPDWVPPEHRSRILDPAEAKGLEYQTVCAIDVGNVLMTLRPDNQAFGDSEDLDQAAKRTAIDHLRVTLSRATETLIFLDMNIGREALDELTHLVPRAIPYKPRDAVEHLRHSEMSTEERVLTRIDEARSLMEHSTLLACERATQAVQLLGDPSLPNGVADIDIRTAAAFTMLEATSMEAVTGLDMSTPGAEDFMLEIADRSINEITASREHGLPDSDDDEDDEGDDEADDTAENGGAEDDDEPGALPAIPNRGAGPQTRIMNRVLDKQHRGAFETLMRWTRARDADAAILFLSHAQRLQALERPNGHWFRSAVRRHAQKLRTQMENGAGEPELARTMKAGNVQKWLELTGYAGDTGARARILTGQAFDTLLADPKGDETARERGRRLEDAESLLRTLDGDKRRQGRLYEAKNEPDEAIRAYGAADRPKDVLRVLRNEGRWEDARKLADGEIEADLAWLVKLDALVAERPAGQNRRLRNGERNRLERLLDRIQRRPSRRAGAATADR